MIFAGQSFAQGASSAPPLLEISPPEKSLY
jgi:hypothetical protein